MHEGTYTFARTYRQVTDPIYFTNGTTKDANKPTHTQTNTHTETYTQIEGRVRGGNVIVTAGCNMTHSHSEHLYSAP